MKRFLPLAIFVVLVGMMAWSLTRDEDRYVPSALVGKPMPALDLPAAVPGKPGVSLPAPGGVRLVNIFASWCVPCIGEAPLLEQLAKAGADIDGIALRDRSEDLAAFLSRHGDPYARIGADPESAAQIALGASGVPETFVVDGRGNIRYHHVGPIAERDVRTILGEMEKAR
jgi:cytochrome c biogenesis protein CcmG/thiol:disulfide interchange protein DsbE